MDCNSQFLPDNDSAHFNATSTDRNDNAWKTVSRRKNNKRHLKIKSPENLSDRPNAKTDVTPDVIITSPETIASKLPPVDDRNSNAGSSVGENGVGEIKKVKANKPKRPKVKVAEAVAKMDVDHLEAYLVDITDINERQQYVKLMQFADYFGKAFSSVNSAKFPWLRIFREASLHQIIDVPLANISQDIYKTSINWIGFQSLEALECFVVWLSDQIFAEISRRVSKKTRPQLPSKSLVDIFVVLAMVLRRKPDVLINLLPILREHPKYQAKDNLPITIWMIAQASEGDLITGLFMWTRFLLPVFNSAPNCNLQSQELILQLVERILSFPKSRTILLSRAVRKKELLVPPSTLDLLMRITYPVSSATTEATERFKAVYPTLKEIALSGVSESSDRDAVKPVIQEILNFAIKAAGEGRGVRDLTREATDIFYWCLTQNPECYNCDLIFPFDAEQTAIELKELADGLKVKSSKVSDKELLKKILKGFRKKNAKARGKKADDDKRKPSLEEPDRRRKAILGQRSKSYGLMKVMLIVSALCAAIMSLGIVKQNL